MSLRLYEDALPIQLEYFVESAQNSIEILREAEQASREKLAIDQLFKNALTGILKVVDKFEKPLDVSKGDIKRVVGNKELLDTINKLTKDFDINERKDILSSEVTNWGLDEFVALSRKTYLYTSNLSKDFTAGYRDNNLLIMNYYKALVANLFALVGECVAYTVSNEPVDYKSLRVTTLRDFVHAYENGGIHKFIDTSKSLMESLGDIKEGSPLHESYDIVQSSVQFIKKFINNVDRDGHMGNIVYKAIDFMKQILIIKQMVWPMVVNMLPRMNEYISLFKSFVSGAETAMNTGNTSKIANQIMLNSSRADDKANYLISIENDQMYNKVQKNWAADKANTDSIDDFKF